MSNAEAREYIERMTQWDQVPTLTSGEVDFLVAQARVPSAMFIAGVNTGQLIPNQSIPSLPVVQDIPPDAYAEWKGTTSYSLGALVVPFPRTGHYYVVTTAGTSGATQPAFPTTTGATVADGTVVWQEAGQALWVPTYNLGYGVLLGWQMKLGKAAGLYDFGSDDQSYKRGQIHAHCQKMVEKWQGSGVTTLTVESSTAAWVRLSGDPLSNLGNDWAGDCDVAPSYPDSGGGEFPWRDY